MLLKNVGRIVNDNYVSLSGEAWGNGVISKIYVATLFGLLPLVFGAIIGLWSPLWADFVGPLISVVGVLTGFSINAIVLLTSHSSDRSYEIKTKVVDQTKDYTLYSILVGIITLVALIIGYILANGDLPLVLDLGISTMTIVSIIVYILVFHYFLMLFVIVHRLYSLVHGNALNN